MAEQDLLVEVEDCCDHLVLFHPSIIEQKAGSAFVLPG